VIQSVEFFSTTLRGTVRRECCRKRLSIYLILAGRCVLDNQIHLLTFSMIENENSVSESPSKLSPAPERVLPQLAFYSVEYAGYVEPTSVPAAIRSLGGQSAVDRAFRRTGPKTDALLELSLRPDNPFSHPIPGDIVGPNNLLLKVIKRKRKRREDSSVSTDGALGEYTAEVVGIMAKTARFRSD